MAAIMLYLFQAKPKPLTILPYAFMPGTDEFAILVRDCVLSDIRYKFRQLEKLSLRALRQKSVRRLVSSTRCSDPRPLLPDVEVGLTSVPSFSEEVSSSSNGATTSATMRCGPSWVRSFSL